MAYTYHGTTDLIALPNRTVQTFPSGLVRVNRSFVCRKSLAVKYRPQLRSNQLMPFDNGAPAIDGLYIFPDPQEIDRGDGFVEFSVTAYGRINTTGSIESNLTATVIQSGGAVFNRNLTIDVTSTLGNPMTVLLESSDTIVPAFSQGFVENLVKKYVIPKSEIVVAPLNQEFRIFDQNGVQIRYPINISLGEGRSISYNYDPSPYDPAATRTATVNRTYSLNGQIEIVPVIKNYQTTDFGNFIEVTAAYSPSFKLKNLF